MTDHLAGTSILITGAGSGFGKLISTKAAARGALLTCVDLVAEGAAETVAEIVDAGGRAHAVGADVADPAAMRAAADAAVAEYGRIDVLINNAGIMPLASFADHAAALDRWHLAIDTNLKGPINGIAAVYDQMIEQGNGHVINISSIYANQPTSGAGVYGATKAGVAFIGESLRIEARGKIKVTTVRPSGVPGTGLMGSVVNRDALAGIFGENLGEYETFRAERAAGTLGPEYSDPESMSFLRLEATHIADAVIYAMDQPHGVSIGDITVRASGDHFVI